MNIQQKLYLLGSAAQGDLACGVCGEARRNVSDDITRWIYPAVRKDGRTVKMLKILQTSACERDCYYCATRRGRDIPRTTLQPDELAQTFDQLHRAHIAEAIFLSSAVAGGGARTMERMLATAELLRGKYQFRGYLHLKLMPGASGAAVERALQLANRVSVNLEAPTSEYLSKLSPTKQFSEELLAPLVAARRLIDQFPQYAGRSMTTQFVVGPAGETDRDIMTRTADVYSQLRLARVYYSAFTPVPNTPLDGLEPTPLIRERRLYEADIILKQYGFAVDDLIFDPHGDLPSDTDPKALWAAAHPEFFPIELNRATREELLRIPGIGPRGAERILQSKRKSCLTSIEHLARLGLNARRVAPFVLLNGRSTAKQLPLW